MEIIKEYVGIVPDAIRVQLQQHDYLPLALMRYSQYSVCCGRQELYDTFLSPTKSHYINLVLPGGEAIPPGLKVKSLLQVRANFINLMLYAFYTGYLYASIWKNDKYDKNVWTYQYMHKKLDGNIYGPFFTLLIPNVIDRGDEDEFKKVYIPESRQVFSIVMNLLISSAIYYKIENSNIYYSVDKNTSFYKKELPEALYAMHALGSELYFSSYGTRIDGKNLMSRNLWGNLDLISPQAVVGQFN